MSISKKDNLYNLIKSLTKNEKKYLRDFLKRETGTKLYLLLFNKIDQQSKHQKMDIKKAFDTKANQLPVIRSYLFKLIQKILNLYHRESTNFDVLYNNFLEVNRLLQRDLYDLAESKIARSLTMAKKSSSPFDQLHALEFQKQFLLKKFGATSENTKKEIVAIIDNQNELLDQIHNLNELQAVQATFYEHFQHSSGLNPLIYTTLDKEPLLQDEKKALTFPAKLLQADLNYRLHIYKDKNFAEADRATQKALRQMESSPELIHDQPQQYLNLLNQRLQLLIHQKKISEIQNILAQIRQAPTTYAFDPREPALRRPLMEAEALELNIYGQTGDHAKASHLIKKIIASYPELNSPLLRQWRTVMNYEIAKYYFSTRQLAEAMEKLKEIDRTEHSQRESEVLRRSILLRAQIALLQKNNLELRKTSLALKNFYLNEKKPTRLEKNLLVFLELWPSCSASPRKQPRLQSQLTRIQSAARQKSAPDLEDLLEWLAAFCEQQQITR